jgi:hypothetical protein
MDGTGVATLCVQNYKKCTQQFHVSGNINSSNCTLTSKYLCVVSLLDCFKLIFRISEDSAYSVYRILYT